MLKDYMVSVSRFFNLSNRIILNEKVINSFAKDKNKYLKDYFVKEKYFSRNFYRFSS